MSLKAIDTQIMIARGAEVSKDAGITQKRTDIAQINLAAKEKINDAQDRSRVAKADESQKAELHPDDGDGGSGGYFGGDGGSGTKEENAENLLVPPGNSVIDIVV